MNSYYETNINLELRTVGDSWISFEVDVPKDLYDDLEELYPQFDVYGKVTLSSTTIGYRLSSVTDVYNSFYRHTTFLSTGVEKSQLWYIDQADLPPILRDLVTQEEIRVQKRKLERLKNLKYADMDEASFNRKDF